MSLLAFSLSLVLLLFSLSPSSVECVDRRKFRTCSETPFCDRTRTKAAQTVREPEYRLEAATVRFDSSSGILAGELSNVQFPARPNLRLTVSVLSSGPIRFSVDEIQPKYPRWRVQDVIMPTGEEGHQAVESTLNPSGATLVYSLASGERIKVEIDYSPLSLRQIVNDRLSVTINARQLLAFEQYRDRNPRPELSADSPADSFVVSSSPFPFDEAGMWSSDFGGHRDSIPRGPSAVSCDVRFHASSGLYGLPEHATSFNLKFTHNQDSGDYSEPYRLYNLDVFEYELDVPMALYGAVPLLVSHSAAGTSAVLWLNSAETFIDIERSDAGARDAHWISESGIIDLFILPGPSPRLFHAQYAALTGAPALPQRFALAYHQCRWNYKSEEDVAAVDAGFDSHDIPYDTLWLDIEHTDGKKYFTWDRTYFPRPLEMQQKLAEKARKMVTIIDPHIKRDSSYAVHTTAEANSYYIKNSNANTYEGWCWPGSVSYLDFLQPAVREYWVKQFQLDRYTGSSTSLFTWNDMNEPSVFNGPEVTMPKDNLHLSGSVEHRDVHNLYGFYNQMATAQGLTERQSPARRPFVLTRSFFAGSQRFGAVWTGDNKAEWSHLKAAQPMLLSLGVAGITFSGADIGGFFGDPSGELFTRWMQAGVFHPFARGHAHIDTKRREPWLFGEPYTSAIRSAIRLRYSLLPFIYTVFEEASRTGMPVMRALWTEFPQDSTTFTLEDSFLLGSAILVQPVVEQGVQRADVYLPQPDRWFSHHTGAEFSGGRIHSVAAPLDVIPLFYRGGSIIAQRWRARRSSQLMEQDPFTLIVALDSDSAAAGSLYIDDGESFEYQNGAFTRREFRFQNGVLSCSGSAQFSNPSLLERVVVLGLSNPSQYRSATVTIGSRTESLFVSVDAATRLTIRKPDVKIVDNFTIQLQN